jgi:hypothetical protein
MRICVAEERIRWGDIESNSSGPHKRLNPAPIETAGHDALHPRHEFGLDAL